MAARVAGKPLAPSVLVGSKDETAGNQLCQLSKTGDGTHALKIGVADRLLAPGDEKYLVIDNVAVPTITRQSMWHWKLALR